MTRLTLAELLGSGAADPGCDAVFEVLDEYVDALLHGEDVTARYPEVLSHLHNCAACREDTDGLLAAIQAITPLPPER